MKKMYEAPKAQRMEFDYSETVVASKTQKCRWVKTIGEYDDSNCSGINEYVKTDYIA